MRKGFLISLFCFIFCCLPAAALDISNSRFNNYFQKHGRNENFCNNTTISYETRDSGSIYMTLYKYLDENQNYIMIGCKFMCDSTNYTYFLDCDPDNKDNDEVYQMLKTMMEIIVYEEGFYHTTEGVIVAGKGIFVPYDYNNHDNVKAAVLFDTDQNFIKIYNTIATFYNSYSHTPIELCPEM